MQYDVVIAGGSLAGLAAATHSARKGARTLLIDSKPDLAAFKCAEGVMEEHLSRAGFVPSADCVALGLARFRLVSPSGLAIDVRSRYYKMLILDRAAFQRSILRMALDAGCEVRHPVRARRLDLMGGTLQLGNGEEVTARTFIDATGTQAALGRQCGLARLEQDELTLVAQWTMFAEGLEEDRFELLFGGPHHSPAGYSWVFPKGNGLFNIGSGGVASQIAKGEPIRRRVESFIKDRVPRPGKRLRYIVSFLPSCRPVERPVIRAGDRTLMLAGDAARLCLPSISAGIASALCSGRWAGENWASPDKYEQVLRRELYPRLDRSYRFKQRNLSDRAIESVFRWRIRPMDYLHRLVPRPLERMAVDMLGF